MQQNKSVVKGPSRLSAVRDAEASQPPQARTYIDLWSRPGFLVRRLHQIHAGLFAEECAAFDVTPVQFAILTVLADGKRLDQVSLSAAVGVDRASGTDVIKRLQRRGYVSRTPSGEDRRAKLVSITPAGRALFEEMHGAMERSQARLISPLSAEELAEFTRLMLKLVEANDGASRAPRTTDMVHDNLCEELSGST